MVKKPSLAEAFATAPRTRKGPTCGVGVVLARMPDDDRQALLEAMADETATAPWLAKILQANGYALTSCQLQRHRRKECRCP